MVNTACIRYIIYGFRFCFVLRKMANMPKSDWKNVLQNHFARNMNNIERERARMKERCEHACINIDTRKCCGEFCHRMEYWRFVMLFLSKYIFFTTFCGLLCAWLECVCMHDGDVYGLIAVSKGTHFVDVDRGCFGERKIKCACMCQEWVGCRWSLKAFFMYVHRDIANRRASCNALCVYVSLSHSTVHILHHATPSPLQKTKFSMFFRLCFIFFAVPLL